MKGFKPGLFALALVLSVAITTPALAAIGDYKGQWSMGDAAPITASVASNGNLYLYVDASYDTNKNRVRYYSPTGSYLGGWGLDLGDDGFVTVAPSGDVYVADPGHQRVQYYSETGLLKGTFSGTTFGYPLGIGFASNGDVFVADVNQGVIKRFTSSGAFLSQFSAPGGPSGLTVS